MSPPGPGFAGNLARRVLTAGVTLPPLLAAFFFGSPLVTVGIVALALTFGLSEFFRLLEARQLHPLRTAGLLLAATLFLDVVYPASPGIPLWPLGALLLLSATLLRRGDLGETIPAAAGTLLGAVYLGGLGATIAALRVLPPVSDGAWRLVLLLAIIMAGDTLAFFCGYAFGRHRLAPLVSPGKTVEGAIGGVLGGMLAALAVRTVGLPHLSLTHALLLGAFTSGMGIVGDLDESLLKRWAGVKDSGTLFPGHGGMLDRLDSLLFGAPVLYYYFLYVQ